MSVSPARAAAFDILLRVERESSYASDLLHSSQYAQLSNLDHALATELVMGVLRWRSRLDSEIAGASSQPLTKLDIEVLIALRLAVYQFQCLERVPARAALHESVEVVKRARKRSAAPFVNAVLRKLSLKSKGFSLPAEGETNPEVLASSFAHPAWMVDRWIRQYGPNVAHKICAYNQSIPETSIRLRTPNAEQELIAAGVSLAPGELLSSALRIKGGVLTAADLVRERQTIIQDEGSQLVALLLGGVGLKSGSRILDCCAAPGGKTLAFADHNPGSIVAALELHPHRARLMKQMFVQKTDSSVRLSVAVADARRLPVADLFDRVLVDVPCSGTGTLARNPEIKWRLALEDLSELHNLQVEILRSALSRVASGGRLVYSTCSLEGEENESVVEAALTGNESFHLAECEAELGRLKASGALTWPDIRSLTCGKYLRTIPGVHPCDGFFAAIFERN